MSAFPGYPKPIGAMNARIHGARSAMAERAESARAAADLTADDRARAALRGKAAAYREAERAIAALEVGTRLPRRKSLSDWTHRVNPTLLIPVSVVVVAAPGWLLAWSRRRSASSDIDWDVHCESMLRMVGARGGQR